MPDLLERDFARQVVDLAEIMGYQHVHFRPAQNRRGHWQTPVEGPLGKGWPDFVFVRPKDRRILFRELKSATGRLTPDQEFVLGFLRVAGADADVWRPADLDSGRIVDELSGVGRQGPAAAAIVDQRPVPMVGRRRAGSAGGRS